MGDINNLRVGWGSQSRLFIEGSPLFLGGVEIAHDRGLGGRLRGDVICHAVIESLLSAAGLPNYDLLFTEDEEPEDAEPLVIVAQTATGLYRQRLEGITNLVVKVNAREPELASYRQQIQLGLASALQLSPDRVAVNIEQSPDHLAGMPDDLVSAHATLGCTVKPVLKKGKSAQKPAGQTTMGLEDSSTDDEPIDESLPPRAKEFEKAVRSKLPPLPKADPPEEGATLIVYTDGASRGNPGPSSVGWVVLNEQGFLVKEGCNTIGIHTNNQAEYLAVQVAADWIEADLGRSFKVQFRLDSELVVRQLRGEWKIKDKELKLLAMKVLNTLMYFDSFEIDHVPRAQNKRADALANKALDDAKKGG